MRPQLIRWLIIGVLVAAISAGLVIGGLMLFGPHRGPPVVVAVAPMPVDEPIVLPAENDETSVMALPSAEKPAPAVSAEQVATAEPPPAAQEGSAAAASAAGHHYVILQIGDSHTAADLFTGEVRDKLQARFGAGGLFLPPGIPKAGVQSAEFNIKADDAWSYEAMASTDEPQHFWLSGYTAKVRQAGASISFAARGSGGQRFDSIDVSFLKTNGGGSANIVLDGNVVDKVSLDGRPGDPLIKRLLPPGPVGSFKTLEIVTTSSGPVELSGVFVDQRQTGVSYLSVGFPGARVTVLKRMAPENLADDMSRIDPDMIVLAFGTNEGFDDNLDPADYQATLTGIVHALMDGRPNRKIVIVGPPPGARKNDSCRDLKPACGQAVSGACWAQPPKLTAVREAEKAVAAAVGATFWDWSSVLPSACDLERGNLGDPAIFGPDRVHMTGKGYRDSADAFAQVLAPLVGKAMGN